MSRKHTPSIFNDEFERIITDALSHREPLVLILRGHLIAEALINDLLSEFSRVGASKTKIRKMTDASFREKIDALCSNGIIEQRLYSPLRALNDARNRFAHLPLKTTFSSSDEMAIVASFGQADQLQIRKSAEHLRLPRPLLAQAMLSIYAPLRVLVEMARNDGLHKVE